MKQMPVESYAADFTGPEDYRGINANMHTVEALLSAADVTGERRWLDRAVGIMTRAIDEFARGNDWALPEHFDVDWNPLLDYNREEPNHPFRPYGATVGHWIEWARLVLHARAAAAGQGDLQLLVALHQRGPGGLPRPAAAQVAQRLDAGVRRAADVQRGRAHRASTASTPSSARSRSGRSCSSPGASPCAISPIARARISSAAAGTGSRSPTPGVGADPTGAAPIRPSTQPWACTQ